MVMVMVVVMMMIMPMTMTVTVSVTITLGPGTVVSTSFPTSVFSLGVILKTLHCHIRSSATQTYTLYVVAL